MALALEAAGDALAMLSTIHRNDALDGFSQSLNQWRRKDFKADTTRLVARIASPELSHILVYRVRGD